MEQKLDRLNFAIEWLEKLEGKEHMIIYCDETLVRVGESRGQIWVTRNKNEQYHVDCVDARYRGYTEMMFWGCYTSQLRGPSYMFGKETASEKKAHQADLDMRNLDYYIQQQIIREQFLAEQAKKPKSRQLKRVPKPEGTLLERNKNAKGGVDWYRYQTYVLLPRLIPFIHEVIEKYGECFLVQDGAPAHNSWQQKELLNIPGLTVLPWPANSPDLNQIEPCWYYLKRCISKRPFRPIKKEPTISAWEEEWEYLDMTQVDRWCGRLRSQLLRCKNANGDNIFHG